MVDGRRPGPRVVRHLRLGLVAQIPPLLLPSKGDASDGHFPRVPPAFLVFFALFPITASRPCDASSSRRVASEKPFARRRPPFKRGGRRREHTPSPHACEKRKSVTASAPVLPTTSPARINEKRPAQSARAGGQSHPDLQISPAARSRRHKRDSQGYWTSGSGPVAGAVERLSSACLPNVSRCKPSPRAECGDLHSDAVRPNRILGMRSFRPRKSQTSSAE
jgi:hypothetical protein